MTGIVREVTIGPCRLIQGDCLDVLPLLDRMDAIICDPPYSSRTHRDHDASAKGHLGAGRDNSDRKDLGYSSWGEEEVSSFCRTSHSICDGWIVCMTDHTLCPTWNRELLALKRYVFAPLPYYAPGSRVRLSGDGPSSWTDWIVVSRTAKQSRWGTLPGGYLRTPDYGPHFHMGGKPVGLMNALVSDYSRKGSLVCDPCMGGGTTGVSCIQCDRRFVGIERNETFFDLSVERIRRTWDLKRSELKFDEPDQPKFEQSLLFRDPE